MQAGPTPVSYPGQYSYQDQIVSTSPAVTYLQTQPVATAPPPSGQTPTGGPPPPPGATPPNLGGTPPAGGPTLPSGPTSPSGVPPPGGPPPPNLNGYAYPPTQAPYNYESVPGPVTGTRSYGMPSRIKNVVKMIQPFYSDSASVDKARTFWDAFDRATEGLEDALRLSAFRECLKGNAGEQWWMYSQINDFETLCTRFHDQFVCQTPLQMIERLKSTKRSKGMSAEVWGDLISSLCYAAQCYDAEMRYQYFLSGLRNKEWKAALATTIVNSIPHAVAVLLFKNMHLPIEDDSEFAEDSGSKPATENAMMKQMLTMMQQTQKPAGATAATTNGSTASIAASITSGGGCVRPARFTGADERFAKVGIARSDAGDAFQGNPPRA
ncbi:hypothetical protein PR002_g9814 [Phytophthora rubi]|uniref:Retrotransposon gag domain-containing protein n=1 Tax=Phytophthora rubi TaxID=129364 RepID=A0A6A3MS17_9STRA|nr:hypothetical protein PR002_g9814 [Phytophthora rubi]